MKKANQDIRAEAKRKGVFLYLIAERMGLQESYLCKKMRHELPAEEKRKIMVIVNELAQEKEIADENF